MMLLLLHEEISMHGYQLVHVYWLINDVTIDIDVGMPLFELLSDYKKYLIIERIDLFCKYENTKNRAMTVWKIIDIKMLLYEE